MRYISQPIRVGRPIRPVRKSATGPRAPPLLSTLSLRPGPDSCAVVDSYGPPRVFCREISVMTPDAEAKYLRPDELHAAFNFPL